MLEIKRKVGQSFIIDRRVTVTVNSFRENPPAVTFAIHRSTGLRRLLGVPVGSSGVVQTLSGAVRIHVRFIDRREVAVGIEAPRSIDIQRQERESRLPS